MRYLMFVILVIGSVSCFAQQRSENVILAEQLGTTAGLAYACKAGKSLEDFEVISSRLLANKAETAEAEKEATVAYVAAKVRAIKMHEKNPQMTCEEILDHFKKMKIFKFVVYADGSVKLDDGKILKPKRPVPTIKRSKK